MIFLKRVAVLQLVLKLKLAKVQDYNENIFIMLVDIKYVHVFENYQTDTYMIEICIVMQSF